MMKKKSILMLIAAGAVLCAVICAAGCISSDEDDDAAVVGTWYHGDDSFEAVLTLAEDNTGIYCLVKDDAGRTGVSGPFPHLNLVVWDVDGDKLSIVCDDGRTITGTVNEKDGSLMTDRLGIGYELVDPAEISGESKFVGTWSVNDGSFAGLLIVMDGNTGMFVYLKDDKGDHGEHPVFPDMEFLMWDEGDDGTLTVYLEDDRSFVGVIDEKTGNLVTNHNTVYERMDLSTPGPSFFGSWGYEDDTFSAVCAFLDNNTGIFCCKKDDSGQIKTGAQLPYCLAFVWELSDDNVITMEFAEDTLYAVFNEKDWTITVSDNSVYRPVEFYNNSNLENIWYYEDDTMAEVSIDGKGNRGFDYVLEFRKDKDGTESLVEKSVTYTFEQLSDGRYEVVRSDGITVHTVMDKELGILTSDDGMVFVRMPDTLTAFSTMLAWAENHAAELELA